jgi:hypothetical protein
LLLALILAQALNPLGNPQGPIFSQPSLMGAMATLEAFPSNGRGTTVPCSATPPTGAKGEPLSEARASSATCTKTASGGLSTTGIADGDLQVLGTNVARVEYSDGVLGLRVDGAGTNSLPRSEELENAVWTVEAGVTVAANYAPSPDGATTAERLTVTSTSGVGQKTIYQTFTVASGAATTCSFYVRGVATGETTDVCVYDGAAWSCSDCVFVAGSHTRCVKSVASGTATTRYCQLGNTSLHNGGVARNAVDLIAWGAQGEANASVTAYNPTTNAAAARAADAASFAASIPTTTGYCAAATIAAPSATGFTAGAGLWAPGVSSAATFVSPYLWPYTSGAGTGLSIDGTGSSAAPASYTGAQVTGTLNRYLASNTGALWRICKDATCLTTASGAWAAATYTHVKLTQSTASGTFIWTKVVVDPNYLRCGP